MEKSQFASGVCGVGPAERTGKPRSRYCPGGSLPLSSLFWRRPRNPREKKPSLMSSPPVLVSLCSYCSPFQERGALIRHAQDNLAPRVPFRSLFIGLARLGKGEHRVDDRSKPSRVN